MSSSRLRERPGAFSRGRTAAVLLTLAVHTLPALSPMTGNSRAQPVRIVFENADTMRIQAGVRRLIGNVRVRRGAMTMLSQSAVHNGESGVLDLTGAVRFLEPGRKLSADHITYYERTGDFDASGSVDFLQSDSVRIRCVLARYIEREGVLELFDQVRILNLSDSALVTGRRGRWLKGPQTAEVEGDVVYRLPDKQNQPPDTLVIKSKRLEFYKTNNAARFTGEVDLQSGDLTAVADSLFYHPDSQFTYLSGAPVIWRGLDQLSGRRIWLTFKDRELQRIQVWRDALALSHPPQDEARANRISGDTLQIRLLSDTLRIINVRGNAQAEYFIWDENDNFQGTNLSAADEIELLLVRDRTESIKLHGGTSGAFYPPGMEPEGTMRGAKQAVFDEP